MSNEADRFRVRARECRELATLTSDEYYRDMLNSLADDLDAEADIIDDQGPTVPMPPVT